MNIKCFLIEPNGIEFRWLRVFGGGVCPNKNHGASHGVMVTMPDGPDDNTWSSSNKAEYDQWPAKCECGYAFTGKDYHQFFSTSQYISDDKPAEVFTLRDAPIGAVWRCPWYEDVQSMRGIDGKAYTVQTPGGTWHIDGIASNCGLPNDFEHKCWVRHGEAPNFTIDKNGKTCSAGAGSILIGNYHGFLRNGELVNC